jgi:trk system potassium uptake protein
MSPRKRFLRLIDGICWFTPAEATVLSFLVASLLGGGLLWYVERGREVTVVVPVLQAVSVQPVEPLIAGINMEPRLEVHAFTRTDVRQGESFIDSLFTAVSALCVTGLTSTDFSRFTLLGQVITLVLIQMGGLGIILFTSFFALLVVRGLSDQASLRSLLAGILDTDAERVKSMLRHVALYTIFFEGLGFFVLGLHLNANPSSIGDINPWWWALFHSVSAFNNAGFGLMDNNLMNFVTDPVVNITIATLIIAGGLGYPVLIALHARLRRNLVHHNDLVQRALDEDVADVVASPVQTRLVIFGTVLLLALGTFLPLAAEWHNPIMAGYSLPQRLMIAFFQSTSTRTAGFNTIDVGALGTATLFLYMLLMYVGANPAGTAGGIKIPTMAVLYGYIRDWFMKPGQPVRLFGSAISKFAVSHAVRLCFFSFIFIGLVTFAISLAEADYLKTPDPTFNFTKVLFEVFSAFGTVGMSMGFAGSVTSFSAILSPFSKVLIIFTMLFGRLGALTILASLPWKRRVIHEPQSPDFPHTQKIQIG